MISANNTNTIILETPITRRTKNKVFFNYEIHFKELVIYKCTTNHMQISNALRLLFKIEWIIIPQKISRPMYISYIFNMGVKNVTARISREYWCIAKQLFVKWKFWDFTHSVPAESQLFFLPSGYLLKSDSWYWNSIPQRPECMTKSVAE